MTDDLVQFLRDRLNEDEQAAHAAADELGADWDYDGRFVVARREDDMVATGSQNFLERERGEHIARHDPAHVLRDVEAKRQLLDTFLPEAAGADEQINDEWRAGSTLAVDLLCIMAVPYSDHPDYRKGWRP